jgi:hypothetical protein
MAGVVEEPVFGVASSWLSPPCTPPAPRAEETDGSPRSRSCSSTGPSRRARWHREDDALTVLTGLAHARTPLRVDGVNPPNPEETSSPANGHHPTQHRHADGSR